jgi:hypothetical protein
LPGEAPPIPNGKTRLVLSASDFQEAKNLETIGNDIMPNTAFRTVTLRGVAGPAMTWLAPRANQCVAGRTAALDVVAGSSRRVTSVRFLADGHQIALSRRGTAGLFSASWRIGKTAKGRHVLVAVATDAAGKRLSAVRPVRVCR